jgi:hypothetical protein
MSDSVIVNEAKKWIDGLTSGTGVQGSWRLETLGKRYRYQKDGEGVRHRVPVRIRRFAKGIPWSLVFEALKYLESQAPYTGFLFNGVRVDAKYRPTSTMWRRDDQEVVGGNAQGSYTLVQDLIEDGSTDFYGVATEETCFETVQTQWSWDSALIEDLPAGEQGVTYSIQSVRRNDDGTFDYALVKRTALTQETQEHEVSDTEYETIISQTWHNVYGTPDRFLNHEGVAVSLPEASSSPDGGVTTRRVTRNDDCTYRVDIERKVPKLNIVSETTSHRDWFEASDTEVMRATKTPRTADPASGGRVQTVKSELRPDGAYDVTAENRQERQAPRSTTEVKVTPFGRLVTVTNRNMDSEAPTGGLDIGATVRNERTKGGLWDQVITNAQIETRRGYRKECHRTRFSHTDKTTDLMTYPPNPEVKRSPGVTMSRQVALTESGAYEVTNTKSTEIGCSMAEVETRTVAKGLIVKTTDRNAASRAKACAPLTVSSVTEGGSYNNTQVVVTATSGQDHSVAERDRFTEIREISSVTVGDSTGEASATGGTNGCVQRITKDLDDNGFITTTTRTTKELPVASAAQETRVTSRAVISSTSSRSVSTTDDISDGTPGTSAGYEITPGGRFNTKRTSVTPRTGAVQRTGKTLDMSSTTTSTAVVVPSVSSGSDIEPSPGVTVRETVEMDTDGVSVRSTEVTTERPRELSTSIRTGMYVSEVSVARLEDPREVTQTVGGDGHSGTEEGIVTETVSETTPTGLVRSVTGTRTVKPFLWELPEMDSGYSYSRTVYFKNYKMDDAKELIQTLISEYTAKLKTWIEQNRGPHSNSIDPQVNFNTEFGTVDGQVRCSATWLPEQAGTNGSLDKEFVQFTYTTSSLVSSYMDKYRGYRCYYMVKTWKHAEGRGLTLFKSYLSGTHYDASFSFNPRTITWAVDVCTRIDVRTTP